jgi:tetratricopeptide (TPR) repeat protein
MLIASTLASLLATAAPAARDPNALTVLAEIALERGDCKTAAETYAAAVPGGSAALAARASEVSLACEHLPAAWAAVQRWRTLAPDDPEGAAVYATIALKLYRLPEARTAIAVIVQSGESDAKLAELTSLLLDEAEPHAVLEALSSAVDTEKVSAATLTLLGELAFNARDLRRAQQYTGRALEQNPNLFEARSLTAQIFAAQGDSLNAIAAARAATRVDAKRGSFELAATLVSLGRIDEARQEFERLRAAGASSQEVDRRLALLAYQNGDFEEARRLCSGLISKSTGRRPAAEAIENADAAHFYLAEIAAHDKDIEAALAGYRRLLNSSLALAARTRAAALLLDRGQRPEALTLLDDYVSEHPESGLELMMTKANLLSEHGEVDSGLGLLDAALERYPQHPALEYDRAVLLERAGRVKESASVLERLLKTRVDDPTLLNALGYTLAEHGMHLAHAEDLIRRALAITPDNPAVVDSLGWVRFKRGDAKGAAVILERAYALSQDSDIAAHWGEALWRSGAKSQARKIWSSALAKEPDSATLQTVIGRFVPLATP